MEKQLAQLEALLFIHGEPLTLKKIAGVLDVSHSVVEEVLAELGRKLSADERGLTLVKDGDRVQLATKPEMSSILQSFIKSELSEELTPASIETLALITYLGPISRSQLEYQRGVNSSFILRNLLLRGLVERSPDPVRSATYLYHPSFELLRHLGVQCKEDLPEYDKFHKLFEAAATEAPPAQA